MDNADFLTEIGACTKVRSTGELKIKRGALLFLGRVNSIKELFPHYHVDFLITVATIPDGRIVYLMMNPVMTK